MEGAHTGADALDESSDPGATSRRTYFFTGCELDFMECCLCEYEVESPDERFYIDSHPHDPILMHESCARDRDLAITTQDSANPITYHVHITCPVCEREDYNKVIHSKEGVPATGPYTPEFDLLEWFSPQINHIPLDGLVSGPIHQ